MGRRKKRSIINQQPIELHTKSHPFPTNQATGTTRATRDVAEAKLDSGMSAADDDGSPQIERAAKFLFYYMTTTTTSTLRFTEVEPTSLGTLSLTLQGCTPADQDELMMC